MMLRARFLFRTASLWDGIDRPHREGGGRLQSIQRLPACGGGTGEARPVRHAVRLARREARSRRGEGARRLGVRCGPPYRQRVRPGRLQVRPRARRRREAQGLPPRSTRPGRCSAWPARRDSIRAPVRAPQPGSCRACAPPRKPAHRAPNGSRTPSAPSGPAARGRTRGRARPQKRGCQGIGASYPLYWFQRVFVQKHRAFPVTPAERHIQGMTTPLVGIIMGSKSDYDYLAPACEMLTHLGLPYEARVLSAHRTPDQTAEYAASAEKRGLFCIIAAAGGAAHLAGVIASKTILPVLGVPIPSTSLNGLDSLLSIRSEE